MVELEGGAPRVGARKELPKAGGQDTHAVLRICECALHAMTVERSEKLLELLTGGLQAIKMLGTLAMT